MKVLALIFTLGALSAIAGCKVSDNDPDLNAACTTGNAQIFVGEGYLRLACGCAEGTNVLVIQGSAATCTVALGTRVLFHFSEARRRHQIVGVGSPNLGASDVVNPPDEAVFAAFAPSLPATGTYQFQDAFNAAVSGQLIVF